MNDLDKLRAAFRAAAVVAPAEVVVPVDDEDIRCMSCGGSGKRGFDGLRDDPRRDCEECGGSGVKREGEKATRAPLSKKAFEARVDKAWWGAKGMRVTLLSDRPPGVAINMGAVDDDTKLTGPGLITDKFEHGTETSVRFSKRMFLIPGGMIAFGAIHDPEGTIAAVFPLDNTIHDGGEYRARFRIVEDTFRIKTVADKPETLDPFDLLVTADPGPRRDWMSERMKAKVEEAKTHAKPFPRSCVDCGKRLVFRPPTGYDPTRCVTCRAKREAEAGGSKLEDD